MVSTLLKHERNRRRKGNGCTRFSRLTSQQDDAKTSHMELSDIPGKAPALRTQPAYRMPNPQDYERNTGLKPLELLVEEKFRSKAMAAIRADSSTILQHEAAQAMATLDGICQSLHREADLAAEDTVFFDPDQQMFWVFPGKRATQNA